MKKKITFLTLLLILSFKNQGFAQLEKDFIIPDSLQSKSYKYLSDFFRSNTNNPEIANLYSKTYLLKAKKSEEKERIITGLLLRGSYYYIIRDFPTAIDYHIQGYEMAKGVKDQVYLNRINHNIGSIRIRTGDYKKALVAFKISLNYYQNNPDKLIEEEKNYHKTIFSIANAFRRLNKPDSALYYNKIGFDYVSSKDLNYYNYLLTKTILKIEFKKDKSKDLNKNLDSIIKYYSKNKKRTDPNIAFAYFYRGKLLLNQGDTILAINKFKKIDSLFTIQKDIHPELRPTYEYLINYYRDKGIIKSELKYVKTLLRVDSVLNKNYRHLDTKIYKKYETPRLIEKKNELISRMKQKSYISFILIILLFITLIIAVSLIFINYRKRKIYHKRYLELIKKFKDQPRKKNEDKTDNHLLSSIPQNITERIKAKLDEFIEKEKFREPNLSSAILANKLSTNTKYLSLIIKAKTGKTYTQFLNNLRIEYAIKRIQKDSIFRKFTIEAMANECGYNNAEVFSKNFYKKTGIYPSYFIQKFEGKK
ncbi:helix-turn-helix domain-containing protein [uncultured Aquimarina sp.]|uniref:helix-turn-helix domain-containing protein n=1 Tax=uncultured Aquimarina sp. TaxID=575652 RepID=UPI002631DAFA|nr:helix-turn-helix domain-containing protein [uncultured Aquimarina sp.]